MKKRGRQRQKIGGKEESDEEREKRRAKQSRQKQ